MVGKDVPPYVLSGRNPLSYAGINVVGLKRRGFSEEKIKDIHDIYRIIYQNGLNITQALQMIDSEIKDGPVKSLISDFVRNSDRGIIKGLSGK